MQCVAFPGMETALYVDCIAGCISYMHTGARWFWSVLLQQIWTCKIYRVGNDSLKKWVEKTHLISPGKHNSFLILYKNIISVFNSNIPITIHTCCISKMYFNIAILNVVLLATMKSSIYWSVMVLFLVMTTARVFFKANYFTSGVPMQTSHFIFRKKSTICLGKKLANVDIKFCFLWGCTLSWCQL